MPHTQSNDEWQDGFLVKDPSGSFRKVTGMDFIDADAPIPTVAPAAPRPATPPPPPRPAAPVSAPRKTPPPPPTRMTPVAPTMPPAPLQPQKPIAEMGMAPSPFMDHEDAEEIKQHTAELQQMVAQPGLDVSVTINAIIERILREYRLTFDTDVMLKRFIKVVESRFREIRNSLETADVLQRPEKIGGLGLPRETVQQIMATVDAEIDGLHMKKRLPAVPAPKPKAPPARAVSTTPQSLYAAPPPAFVPRPGGAAPKPSPTAPQPSAIQQTSDLAKEIKEELTRIPQKPAVIPPAPPVPPPAPAPSISPAAAPAASEPHELYGQSQGDMPRIRPVQPNKPYMIDIKQPSAVVGPVDEIRQIDLKEFRRMGTNPGDSADRVYEKIELLEEESWDMRMQGVRAWRQSPLFTLYVTIGRASMESGNPVDSVISKRQQAGEPTLLPEEFMAVNALNAKLTV